MLTFWHSMIDGKRDEGKGSVLSGVGMTVFIGKALVLSGASEAKKKKMADQTP